MLPSSLLQLSPQVIDTNGKSIHFGGNGLKESKLFLVSHFWRRKGFVLAGSFRRGEDVMKGREPPNGSRKMGDHTLSPHRKQRERGQEVRQAIQLQSQPQVA